MGDLPAWVPDAARNYLVHTEMGQPIRALARKGRVHASTVLRQVRRFEGRRDDPLVDDALRKLSSCLRRGAMPDPAPAETRDLAAKDLTAMTHHDRPPAQIPSRTAGQTPPSAARFEREAARVLRRLGETGAVLAVARDMDMGVVVRDDGSDTPQRTAVVERDIAEAMALKEWIGCTDPAARIVRYRITGAGRAALKELLARAENRAQGFAEAASAFLPAGAEDDPPRGLSRGPVADSPLAALARRRDKDGKPFLSRDLVAAGERLREDFEMAHAGSPRAQDWEALLAEGPRAAPKGGPRRGAMGARDRVAAALAELGPGLADVALRCCCFLEGLESLERRMGWSARSGKIVLRIALQRLKRHYEGLGAPGQMIG